MEGLIIKILSDKCYVKTNGEVIVCSIRGKFRSLRLLPFVGDHVIIDEKKKVIEKILPRENEIRRPPVSNITQAIIVTSFKNPDFSTNLIDKILIELEFNSIKPIICLTKKDLLTNEELNSYKETIDYYNKIGYPVYYNDEIEELKKVFKNEVTVLIGQTGAGKSTLLNKLDSSLNLKTGEVSLALGRGRHTTRHVEMIELFDGMLLDTPGFSALEFQNMTKIEVRDAFVEFRNFPCLYRDCMHTNESDCMVKQAVDNNKILKSRYENYLKLMETALSESEKYKRK